MRIWGLILNSTKFFPLFESADALTVTKFFPLAYYSRVWNKRTPLNKRSPLENLAKRIIVAPFFTLYYEVRNKAVAPGKKSKN